MATGLKLLIEPLLPQQAPFLLLAGAVMVAAWFGGLGPGLVATALGALSADYFYLAPVGSFTGLVGGAFWLQVLFVLQGVLITSLAQALHLARQRAEKSALEVQRLQEKLAERERQLHSLVGRMIDAQEEERCRVAYEVHDGFTQMVAGAYRRLDEVFTSSASLGISEIFTRLPIFSRFNIGRFNIAHIKLAFHVHLLRVLSINSVH
jgi:signal transduction histidine kinase